MTILSGTLSRWICPFRLISMHDSTPSLRARRVRGYLRSGSPSTPPPVTRCSAGVQSITERRSSWPRWRRESGTLCTIRTSVYCSVSECSWIACDGYLRSIRHPSSRSTLTSARPTGSPPPRRSKRAYGSFSSTQTTVRR